MTALERAAAQLARHVGISPANVWDFRLDPHWRGIVCRVAQLVPEIADDDWCEMSETTQLRLSRAMLDAYRVGRAIARTMA